MASPAFGVKPEPVSSATLVIEGVPKHPVMALTPDAIEQGRANFKEQDWARRIGDSITSAADVWLKRDLTWIKEHMPPKGAAFAYGFAGCPECGGKTAFSTSWSNALCSFDNPGHANCENGHTLPNEKYPDEGKGYKGADGRMHYFVGIYNAWAVEHFKNGAYDLAYAYSLTGNEQYRQRSVEILDALADIYPTCTVGSWDYPETKPGMNHGRMNRPQYQVGRVLITLADTFDQVFHSKALDEPSVREGLTRRENIEKNMLQDGAWYCYNQSFNFNGLTNGEADYIKGAMVVGLVLGMPEYVRWAVDGPYGIRSMLANNIGRDGTYYETATGYAYYTRSIYRGYAEYLLNYRGSAYPVGVNLYQDPRFRDFMLLMNLETQIGGAIPSYGDAAAKPGRFISQERPFDTFDFECLEYLRARATDPEEKQQYRELIDWMSNGKPEDFYEDSHSARWLLFHAEPPTGERSRSQAANEHVSRILETNMLGQKGLAMLRAGEGAEAQGVMMRYGPSLNHANYDELNFTYHALGRDLTYDLGYHLGSAHVYAAWSKQTASHQLVVVDETSQGAKGSPSGGSLLSLWKGDHTSAVEASSPATYRPAGVEEYARTLFLVSDVETTASYLVDIFRVSGGSKHDSFTHSLGTDVKFGSVSQGEKTSSSLAGTEFQWGDKVLVDGDIAGQANKPYWLAPPGNGYGFLMEPFPLEPTADAWWADWKLPDGEEHVRLWYPTVAEESVVSAWAPGVQAHLPKAQYVVRRREPHSGSSVFVTVWEPHRGEPRIEGVKVDELESSDAQWPAIAVRVKLQGGREDILYSSADTVARPVGNVHIGGRLGRISFNGEKVVTVAEGLGLTELNIPSSNTSITVPASYRGLVETVDAEKGLLELSLESAGDAISTQAAKALPGQTIVFSNRSYSRSTAYKIRSVRELSGRLQLQLTEPCIIGRGVVESIDKNSNTVTSAVSHEYAKPVHRKGESEFFKGKRIRTSEGAEARVQKAGFQQPLVLTLDTTNDFNAGDEFFYEDVQAGDAFEVLLPARLQ